MLRYKTPGALYGRSITQASLDAGPGERENAEIFIGDRATTSRTRKAENHLQDKRIAEFYVTVKNYYRAAAHYVKDKLPLDNDLLHLAEVADVEFRFHGTTVEDLAFFLDRFPSLVPEGASRESLELEFADYQSAGTDLIQKKDRMVSTSVFIGKNVDGQGYIRFQNLARLMLGILTILHSNAACKMVFSEIRKNKTPQRAGLGPETLDTLLVVKSVPGEPHLHQYSHECYQKLKSAYYQSLKK